MLAAASGGWMLRRLRLTLVLAGLGMAVAGAAAGAAERVVMPFSCTSDNGRFRITPSSRRAYPIVAQREEQAIRVCVSGAAKCRALTLHRFAIDCGDVRVPWFRVVAASRAFGLGRTWIDNGQLVVVWKAPRAGGPPCPPAPPLGFTLPFFKSPKRTDCGGGDQQPHRIAMPAGFAPLTEIGARLVDTPPRREAGPVAAAAPATSAAAPEAPTPQEIVIAEPMPHGESTPDHAAPGFGDGARRWFTVIPAEDSFDRRDTAASWGRLGLVAAALTALLGLAGAAAWRWRPATVAAAPAGMRHLKRSLVLYAGRMAVRIRRRTAGFRVPDAAPEGTASVAAYFNRARDSVERLDAAGPLQEVLRGEMEVVRQRLDAAIKAEGEGGEAAVRTPAVLRTLVRELERIMRIADGAAMSLAAGQPAASGALPRTRAEAYALLGVNPDVSDAVLKKLGDALRMSWHPDHARDEADRVVREERIKQINAALELIKAERQTAA